jgi:hypothetical protein
MADSEISMLASPPVKRPLSSAACHSGVRSSALCSSAADWNRSDGFLRSERRIVSASSAPSSGRSERGSGAASSTWARMSATLSSDTNGRRPHASSNSITPTE